MHIYRAVNGVLGFGTRPGLRCPSCRQVGTFEPFEGVPDLLTDEHWFGQRRCPNGECNNHVFVVLERESNRVVVSYPPEILDFDTSGIPPNVVAAITEALACHANQCFVAAAIMIRKSLEEVCVDRNAIGDSLVARLANLKTKVVLPEALLDGLTELRLLGNDAAHVESKVFEEVGQAEIEVAIEVAKEVMKAVYQYDALVGRLQGLKKRTAGA